MSEEQPIFKVTDRRLFNADGSPREGIAAKEEQEGSIEGGSVAPELTASGNSRGASMSADAPAAQQTPGNPSGVPEQATSPLSADAAQNFSAGQSEEDYAEGEMEGPYDDDPASFTNFLMSIASNAAASLGLMEHPATGLRAVDLPLAKHWIDTLGMLQQKTRGNLTPQERQIMEGLLADMRMQFVALTTGGAPGGAAPRGGAGGAGRKFSGSDITGGR